MSWLQIKKAVILKCHLLLFHATNTNHFSTGLWLETKSGLYTTTSNNQFSGWTKKQLQSASQSQTPTQKRSWSLVVCCQSDLLQLSESQQNHYIWEVCSVYWWNAPETKMPGIGQQKGPNSSSWQCLTAHRTTKASKVGWTGLQDFASSAIFTWPPANWLPFLQESWQLFAGKMFS